MPSLSPGANAPLPDARELTVRLRARSGHADLVALLLDEAGRADGDDGVVLFSHPQSAGGSVRLDQATDTLTVAFGSLPARVERILLVAQADEQPDLSATGELTVEVLADGAPVAHAALPAPGIPTLQLAELYRRQGAWKVRALGDGYADGLAKLLTVHGVEVDDDPAPAPVGSAPPAAGAPPAPAPTPTPAPDPISFEKQRRIDLTKKAQAKGGVDLAKKIETAGVSLDKHGLTGQRAEVILVLDVSGSSRPLFRKGVYGQLVERFLAAALLFDDDGVIPTYLFDDRVREGDEVTIENYRGWADEVFKRKGIWGATSYAPPLQEIARRVDRGAATPTYVAFVTDGGNQDRSETTRTVTEIAGKPVFLKFMAIGREDDFPFLQRLDDLTGREVDNADFFAVEDPLALSDARFYDLLMQEFLGWIQTTRRAGILGG